MANQEATHEQKECIMDETVERDAVKLGHLGLNMSALKRDSFDMVWIGSKYAKLMARQGKGMVG